MTLHIFNPEHDIALASGLQNFTAPHAGRQLRHDLGWLPILWAREDDMVWTDNTGRLPAFIQSLHKKGLPIPGRVKDVSSVKDRVTKVEPWGWNPAIRAQLTRQGLSADILPAIDDLAVIRSLSHRRTSANLLESLITTLNDAPLAGESHECYSVQEVENLLQQYGKAVVKAPWSSSGRGVRFIDALLSESIKGWLKNVLIQQGCVMLEPYYNKIRDFGMEFESDGEGSIRYLGLSLFHTQNGAYTGNLLATENYKRKMLEQYLPDGLLDRVRQTICRQLGPTLGCHYKGPLGIDMMILTGFRLHPCVEINLRRTMGHVALSLNQWVNPEGDDEVVKVMRIVYEGNQYKMKCINIKNRY